MSTVIRARDEVGVGVLFGALHQMHRKSGAQDLVVGIVRTNDGVLMGRNRHLGFFRVLKIKEKNISAHFVAGFSQKVSKDPYLFGVAGLHRFCT